MEEYIKNNGSLDIIFNDIKNIKVGEPTRNSFSNILITMVDINHKIPEKPINIILNSKNNNIHIYDNGGRIGNLGRLITEIDSNKPYDFSIFNGETIIHGFIEFNYSGIDLYKYIREAVYSYKNK